MNRKHFCEWIFVFGILQFASLGTCGETYVSPATASPIFKYQGEFMGVIESWGGTWGAQVIALDEKKLEAHLLQKGLPGLGFEGGKPSKSIVVTLNESNEPSFATGDSFGVSLKADGLEVVDANRKKLGVLTKVIRESKTLGAKPPEGAIVLFDQNGINRFKNGKTNDRGYLMVGCTSEEQFADHSLHIEFMTPFQPSDSGQKRGNSGVYVQGRYEVQVLDSFGLAGEDNECGGIYKVAKPKWNMCYPPLTWQTYDIDFTAAKYNATGEKVTNAKITIRHNGVVIHDQLELPKATPGKDPEGNSPGPLFLQNHNNPVVFRNIWVKVK